MIRQAIETRCIGATDDRPMRFKATAQAGSVYVDAANVDTVENHKRAVRALAHRFEWDETWLGGALPKVGYCWVAVRPQDKSCVAERTAIVTKMLAATGVAGVRLHVSCFARPSIVVPWDHDIDINDNHLAAAREMSRRYNWGDKLAGGVLPSGAFCWVKPGGIFA